jgi:hypothetical protein
LPARGGKGLSRDELDWVERLDAQVRSGRGVGRPRDSFLIFNHADEMTPWCPLLAALTPGDDVGFLNQGVISSAWLKMRNESRGNGQASAGCPLEAGRV